MNLRHIIDGSLILVEHTSNVNPGEVAVVIINSDEATVKEFHKSNNIVNLIPYSSSDDFKTMVIDTNKTPVKIVERVLKVVIDVK